MANPFDQKYNHQRFTVLNDKRRGQNGGRPAHARERAQEIRKKTLLPQMRERGRVGALKDRRFGASLSNSNEVQVERFKAEKLRGLGKRAARRSIFNLGNDDDDDDDLEMTHGGQAIGELEEEELQDFDEQEDDVEGEDEDRFGNFSDEAEEDDDEEGPARKKSKTEVMSEIIAKSKKHRVERQRMAQETAEMIEKLDEDLATIRGALSKRDEEKRAVGNSEFDEAVRTMTFDRRVQPADRTKTAEEIQQQARERRREAQEAAAKRQAGESGDDDAEEADEVEADFSHFTHLLDSFAKNPQDAYRRMAEAAQGKEAVLLGKAIRAKLQALVSQEGTTSLYGPRPAVPSLSVCLMLHAIGRIYSTGDRHHVIVTPAALYLGMLLQRMRISTSKHLIYALFLAQVALEYARTAKRFVPEVLNLLEHVLSLFCGQTGMALPRSARLEKELSCQPEAAVQEPLGLADLTETVGLDRILGATLYLLSEAAQLWAGQVVFPELFQPSLDLVSQLKVESRLASLLESLMKPARAKRLPLRLQQHKPIPLPLLTPALDQPRRDEGAILKHQIKREAKGARRELLRDNRFLADQQRIQKAEQSERYQSMLRKVHGTIANDGANISFGGDFKKKRRKQ